MHTHTHMHMRTDRTTRYMFMCMLYVGPPAMYTISGLTAHGSRPGRGALTLTLTRTDDHQNTRGDTPSRDTSHGPAAMPSVAQPTSCSAAGRPSLVTTGHLSAAARSTLARLAT